MPELPEVQTVLEGLVRKVGTRKLIKIESYYPTTVICDPESSRKFIPGAISNAFRRGKYMIVMLDSGTTLIIHLRMTGKLVYDAKAIPPTKHERARIYLEDGAVIHFIDPRTFGKIIICNLDNFTDYLPELGLEPLNPEFTIKHLKEKLQRRTLPIKQALLDQKVIAGLGNIYVCEILFRAKLHPLQSVNSLSDKDYRNIIRYTRQVLSEAILKGGTSISDFRRIDDQTGEFQEFLRVYQKASCPQGHPLARVKIGGRGTFYCPQCQKMRSQDK